MRVSQTRSRVAKSYVAKEAGDYSTDRTDTPREARPPEEHNAMSRALRELRDRMQGDR